MQGDQTLFARSDWIDEAWSIVDPVIQHWETQTAPNLPLYATATWGPKEAHELLVRDGRAWHAG
jgi:glucose-6-phosphate 1-dehydrogenase